VSAMTRWLRENVALIEKEGGKVILVEPRKGSHVKLVVRTPHGDKTMFLAQSSCSDRHAIYNNRAAIRRMMRG